MPVQADGRLAAAGAALDDDHAGVGRGDELELARIDERGDLGQVAIEPLAPPGAGAQHAALARGRRARCPARRRARSRGSSMRAPAPPSRRARSPLRAGDAHELALVDGHACGARGSRPRRRARRSVSS